MRTRVYKTTTKLSDAQIYGLVHLVRRGRVCITTGSKTLACLERCGLVEFRYFTLGGEPAGEWRATEAGKSRVQDDYTCRSWNEAMAKNYGPPAP